MKSTFDQKLMAKALSVAMALSLVACSSAFPPRDESTGTRINDELKRAGAPATKPAPAKVPETVSSSLLPPKRAMPRMSSKQLQERFDLRVNDAPIDQVLTGIIADTPYSIMLKPKSAIPAPVPSAAVPVPGVANTGLKDRVTVHLKNVTLFEALDAIREVYGYDYTVEDNRIYVQPPELQTRLYQVNYMIGQRRGVSDLQVVGGASTGSSSTSGSTSSSTSSSSSGSGSGSTFSSVQASALSSISKSDLWGEVEDTVRTTLGCQIPRSVARTGGAAGGSGSSGSSSSSSTSGPSRADVSFVGDSQTGDRQRGVDGCTDGRAMSISQMSGTIMVRGMPNEHRMIEKLLRALQLNIERQVIIEAKIIDVQLNSGSQQGVNWGAFNSGLHRASVGANMSSVTVNQPGAGLGGGTVAAATTLGTALGTALVTGAGSATSAFAGGLGLAVQFRNFSALINFLQTQGEVQVLSSPRIATLNSQKAVIKVGTEEPYVASITPGTTAVAAGAASSVATNANLNYQPFFSGISLDVTPKIDDKDNITLHVHAMVNTITEKNKAATTEANPVQVPFAVNTISETDSVVKARDGQVVVIGGLMTESTADDRSKIPGAGDIPGPGALFSKGNQRKVKRELVILLKPTVVKDDKAWNDDIVATQGRIESLEPKPPVQKAPQ